MGELEVKFGIAEWIPVLFVGQNVVITGDPYFVPSLRWYGESLIRDGLFCSYLYSLEGDISMPWEKDALNLECDWMDEWWEATAD